MEVAHPNALFVLTSPGASCEDIEAVSIRHKAAVKILQPNEPEPSIGAWPPHRFFVKYTWSPSTAGFEDARPQLAGEDGIRDTEHRGCVSCASEATDNEISYHVNDFVYFQSNQHASANQTPAYRLGQITALISDAKVEVRLLGRWDNVMHALKKCVGQKDFDRTLAKDETRLFLMTPTRKIERKRLAGKFFVHSKAGCDADPKDWFALENHFWLDMRATTHPVESLDDLVPIAGYQTKHCEQCVEEEQKRIQKWRDFVEASEDEPFRGLELFSGCGGLATALDEVFCQTSWAVERDKSAALTLSKMHPNCVVHTADVNDALRTIIRTGSAAGFPDRDESIGVLFGGPPCQGFSTLNRHRSPSDERNLLFANMLSWVDVYRPTYFLLENVGGMLSIKLRLELAEKDHPAVDVEFGTVKLIVRVLAALGYQARVHYLQAGMYGAPQSRHRLVIFGCRLGTELPIAPHATHAFQGRTKATKRLPGGLQLLLRPEPGCAFQGVSLGDAIGDLPAFDWKNPHIVIAASADDREKEAGREKYIPAFLVNPLGSAAGFAKAEDYRRHALTSFQRRCRGNRWRVTQQQTRTFGATAVERACNVPGRPGACHLDVPEPLALGKQSSQHANKPYGRLDFAVPAPVLSAQMTLSGASGQVLHPTQNRCLTVREAARIQGFPDWYEFSPTDKLPECYKQIGNAVPLPLGTALARAIQQSRFAVWVKGSTAEDGSSTGIVDSVSHLRPNRTSLPRASIDVLLPTLDANAKASYIPIPLSQQWVGSDPQIPQAASSLPTSVPSSLSRTLVLQDTQRALRRRLHMSVDLPILDAETRRLYYVHN
ncbi:S-adenosyl-L-methionine-dependent methyltransferase [Auricularia subglabra TFB-10046 SS5]|nr:S-adenosyl-L-methionine-dependent methyltransferase [Auricularia subglabra TFB-10046 SS5]